MFAFKRSERVREVMQREISIIIRDDVKDPRIGFVTVTSVELSDKLNFARVYISPMGSDEQKIKTFSGIKSARGFIRTRLGHKMKIKYIPEIQFKLDDAPNHSDKINRLLHQLAAEQTEETKETSQ